MFGLSIRCEDDVLRVPFMEVEKAHMRRPQRVVNKYFYMYKCNLGVGISFTPFEEKSLKTISVFPL